MYVFLPELPLTPLFFILLCNPPLWHPIYLFYHISSIIFLYLPCTCSSPYPDALDIILITLIFLCPYSLYTSSFIQWNIPFLVHHTCYWFFILSTSQFSTSSFYEISLSCVHSVIDYCGIKPFLTGAHQCALSSDQKFFD